MHQHECVLNENVLETKASVWWAGIADLEKKKILTLTESFVELQF